MGRFSKNRGGGRRGGRGFKRSKLDETLVDGRNGIKRHRVAGKVDRSPSPSSSGDLSEEQLSNIDSEENKKEEEEVMVYKEPSMYNNLLKTLVSGSDSLANMYMRRQREEANKSDTEDDMDDDSNSSYLSAEDVDVEDGSDTESDRSHDMKSKLEKPGMVGRRDIKDILGTGVDDEDVVSDIDQRHDLRDNDQSVVDSSVSISSFSIHLGHQLSEGEADKLSKRKLKYRWEAPSVGMSKLKWRGTEKCSSMDLENNSGHGLKPKLCKHWLDTYASSGGHDFKSSMERSFFSLCNSYQDILHYNKKPFYRKGMEEDSNIMDAYIMHSLNHVFRSRDLVMKNDAKVCKNEESAKDEILTGDTFLDHGFTRPKVLILLPLASIAYRVVKRLIQLTPSNQKVNVEHFDRFTDDFGSEVEPSRNSSKASDFRALFGGNNNDHFMIGVKYTRKSIKLYSDFYTSDLIIASPLGLITKIGEAEAVKERDVDYLSSIEVLIVDHADVMAMQNWSHVDSVVEQLNRIPSKQHGTDVMRIRQWYLEGQARYYRQTIILGSYLNPDMNALFNNHCVNFQGKLKLACDYKGVLPKVLLQVQQIYKRFNAESIMDADDARLEYFTKKVLPKIKSSVQGGVMIFISSYFEFVRVRNFLKSQNEICLIGDYTKQSDISRSRIWFLEGTRKIMLYTERAHFYHRYKKIRGIQTLIMYSLPERKEFYPEIVNMLEGSEDMTCTVLFSQLDHLRLERVVGTEAAKSMISSERDLFTFR